MSDSLPTDRAQSARPRWRARVQRATALIAIVGLVMWHPGEGTSAVVRFAFIVVAAVVLVILWNAEEFTAWRAARRGAVAIARNPTRQWALRVAGVLLFALVTGHAFARASGFRAALRMSGYDVSDPAVCRLIPNTHQQWTNPNDGSVHEQRINALGFRGADVSSERRRPDTLRVALFGDSMIYGIGVEDDETLAAALRAELQAAFPERDVEVLNFGIPNTTVHTSLRNYFSVARGFRPDAIVISHAINVNPNDVCVQIREIQNSRLLSWLMRWDAGRELVNDYLLRKREVYSRSRAIEEVKASLRALAADQQATGMEVAFLEHWEYARLDRLLGGQVRDDVDEITPDELHVRFVSGGIDMDEYERRFAIPGDGHPTAEGQRYYAKRLADVLVPALREKK